MLRNTSAKNYPYVPGVVNEGLDVFDEVFGDDPTDEIRAQYAIDDKETKVATETLLSIIRGYGNLHPSKEEVRLKPYLVLPSVPDRPFLWQWWLDSILRLVAWRMILFMGVATMWFLLLVYRDKARTIIPNVTAMYTVLIFITSLLLSSYFERVLDRFRDAKVAFQNCLRITANFGMTFTAFLRSANDRIEAEPRQLSDRFNSQWSGVDGVVHLQYLMHAIPFAILADVRNKLNYDRLPLFKYQITELKKQNGIDVDRIEPMFNMIHNTLVELESQGLLMKNIDARVLFTYLQQVQNNMTAMEESVSNSIPPKYLNILNRMVFVFMIFLPPLIWDLDGWGWSYLFYAVVVYLIYGFMRQSEETRNPLEDVDVSERLHAPVEHWALLNCAEIDRSFEAALAFLIKQGGPRAVSHFPLREDGSVEVKQLGYGWNVQLDAPTRPPPPKTYYEQTEMKFV